MPFVIFLLRTHIKELYASRVGYDALKLIDIDSSEFLVTISAKCPCRQRYTDNYEQHYQ